MIEANIKINNIKNIFKLNILLLKITIFLFLKKLSYQERYKLILYR